MWSDKRPVVQEVAEVGWWSQDDAAGQSLKKKPNWKTPLHYWDLCLFVKGTLQQKVQNTNFSLRSWVLVWSYSVLRMLAVTCGARCAKKKKCIAPQVIQKMVRQRKSTWKCVNWARNTIFYITRDQKLIVNTLTDKKISFRAPFVIWLRTTAGN